MSLASFELTPRDPIIARDSRPFGAGQGNRMRSLDWPLPSVIAGSLRTAIGKAAQKEFSLAVARDLLEVSVHGVFPLVDDRLYLPAPADCVLNEHQRLYCARPVECQPGEGCDLPEAGLRPVMIDLPVDAPDFKPRQGPTWWPVEKYARWLAGELIEFDSQFLMAPEFEERTHVVIEPATGAAEEGQLFSTAGLPLRFLRRWQTDTQHGEKPCLDIHAEIKLVARVGVTGWCEDALPKAKGLHPTGGERRLVHWQPVDRSKHWNCPDSIAERLQSAERVRMILATPAIFATGWKPAWLSSELEGSPPGSSVRLRLVGAAIQRWRAVSGWSLAKINEDGRLDEGGKSGPKPIRRMVPSGGVYFFEILGGAAESLSSNWLQSVSDDPQDQRDGFGLATWGTW